MSKVIVLLACYNGDKYLDEQIASIVEQTHKDWLLLIRDDGSTDNTLRVIEKWAKLDNRISLLNDENGATGSSQQNFSLLMKYAMNHKGHIFCFSDQDDVWVPEKIQVMLKHLNIAVEQNYQSTTPCLLHSDLEVVDKQLNLRHQSFVKLNKLLPKTELNPARLLTRNEVTGCTMMFNRALLRLAFPVPEKSVMHDWWLALVSAYCGKLTYVDERLVKYRQHDSNVIGAKSFYHGISPGNQIKGGWSRGNDALLASIHQAGELHKLLSREGKTGFTEVEMFSRLAGLPRFQRIIEALKLPIWRSHWLLNVALLLRLFALDDDKAC